MAFAWLAQRGTGLEEWVEIILAVVVFGGAVIAQGLKKIIDGINEKKAAQSKSEASGPGESARPVSRSPQRGASSQPPTAKPLPPRIRRAAEAPRARPLPPRPATGGPSRQPPVAQPMRPVPSPAPPRQTQPATPPVIMLEEDQPARPVWRRPMSPPAGRGRPQKDGPERSRREDDRKFNAIRPEDHLGQVDPEAHLGQLDDHIGHGTAVRAANHPMKWLTGMLTGRELGHAIVLSEILGPPLALRDAPSRDPWDA